MEQEESKGTGKKWLIIAIIFILLAINGIQLYLQNLSKKDDIPEKIVVNLS